MKTVVATYAQIGAEELENKTQKQGFLVKMKNYLALLFGSKEKRKAAMLALGLASAE
jgi:hypothetical protein